MIYRINVGKYTLHGAYGIQFSEIIYNVPRQVDDTQISHMMHGANIYWYNIVTYTYMDILKLQNMTTYGYPIAYIYRQHWMCLFG